MPNVFIKQQLERKFNELIVETLKKNGLTDISVEYKIQAIDKDKIKQKEEVIILNENPAQRQRSRGSSLSHQYRQGLNERYTFDNFIVGAGNELAYAACQAIVAHPGQKYNPLFLYGGVGIGKTHLIQAVGNAVLKKNPDARIVYASTEQFVQEFVDALRFKKNTDFAGFYRGADVLIVDDVQFLMLFIEYFIFGSGVIA